MPTTFTRRVLARRWWVVGFWLVALVVAVLAMRPTSDALTQTISIPGREGFDTNARILSTYGNGGSTTPIVPVITLPKGTTVDSPGVRKELARVFGRIQRSVPSTRVVSYASNGDRGFVSPDGRTTFALVYSPPPSDMHKAPAATSPVRSILSGERVAGAGFRVSGLEVQKESPDRKSLSAGVEGVIGFMLALIVLLLAFRSALAVLPVVMAVISIVTSYSLLWIVTRFADVSFLIPYFMTLIGLGISVDYALLLVSRWREERKDGVDAEEAAVRAVGSAGRAVILSGLTVAVGLLALILLPVPFLRSIGYGGMLIPLVAVSVQLTLLPVALATIGPRLERLSLPRRRETPEGERWARWSSFVIRRPALSATAALALLALLIVPLFSLNVRMPRADALASQGAAREGRVALQTSGIGTGALAPIEIVTPRRSVPGLTNRLRRISGVRAVVAPNGPDWRRRGGALVSVVPSVDTNSTAGRKVLASVREAAHEIRGAQVGGASAQSADFVSAVYSSFPEMIAVIALVTLLALGRAFRSLVLPIKALALNALSVSAALGAVVLVWQLGYGSELIWDVPATGALAEFVPLLTFAFLFGISMDYEVFLLSRMREEYDSTGSTDRAVVEGMRRTGRLVTLAGLILIFAFVSLSTSTDTNVNVFATGLALGILIDATVVRAVLVPALVALMGRWNWWLPRWAARALRVAPAPEAAR